MKKLEYQSGSALIEALVSVLIFSIGLIALVGLSIQANNQLTQSSARNEANNLASELIGDMWTSSSTPATFDTTAWKARAAAELHSSTQPTVTVTGNQVYILITWPDPKTGDTHQYETTAEIAKN